MVIDTYRIAKNGKLSALVWLENKSIYIKEENKPAKVVVDNAEKVSVFLYVKSYCDENCSKEIGKISLDKEDLHDFFERVNTLPNYKIKPKF
jgi:succinylglutamate desuccinylase